MLHGKDALDIIVTAVLAVASISFTLLGWMRRGEQSSDIDARSRR